MHAARFSLVSLVLAALTASIAPAAAQAMTVDEFRRELVGVPLCGTPETGPLAGKALCTVHLPDGTAILAGAGLVRTMSYQVSDHIRGLRLAAVLEASPTTASIAP